MGKYIIKDTNHNVNKCKNIVRRYTVHPINQARKTEGKYATLMPHLELDDDKFRDYFHLTREQSDYVLAAVEQDLQVVDTSHLVSL